MQSKVYSLERTQSLKSKILYSKTTTLTSHLKNIKKNYIIPPAENMINITTLPGNINYNSTLDSSNFDYFNNNSNFESYETASYEKINNESFNSISSTTNQVKTVKMIKQKDKHQKMQNNYINSFK